MSPFEEARHRTFDERRQEAAMRAASLTNRRAFVRRCSDCKSERYLVAGRVLVCDLCDLPAPDERDPR